MSDAPSPDRGPGAGEPAAPAGSGPLLALLARGLELWLRQQCQAIEEVQIELEGSAAQLMRGRLEGVRLRARRVLFQQLEIERVELRSEPLQVRMGALLRRQSLQLEHPFRIEGAVAFSAEGLSRSLCTPPWSALGDALAEELLGLAPLAGLRIEGDCLLLRSHAIASGRPLERRSRVRSEDGTVVLQLEPQEGDDPAPPGGRQARLPMDANIRIVQAEIGGGQLELRGEARVSP